MTKPTDSELKQLKENAVAWATERLADPNTVFCDVETTGLPRVNPDTEIVQLTITDAKTRPLFSMLLKPNQPMSDEVIGIHNITNEQVINQPMFPQIAKMVAFVLENKHIVCYNSGFDVKLLWSLFKKYEQPLPKVAGVSCAMEKYSEFLGEWNDKKEDLKWHKLPNLSGMPAHDAYSDCISTVRLLEMMASKFDPSNVEAGDISLDF